MEKFVVMKPKLSNLPPVDHHLKILIRHEKTALNTNSLLGFFLILTVFKNREFFEYLILNLEI